MPRLPRPSFVSCCFALGLLVACGADAPAPKGSAGVGADGTATSPTPAFAGDFPDDDLADYAPHPILKLYASRTLVLFRVTSSGTDVDGLAKGLGATIVGRKPALGVYVAKALDPGDHTAVDALVAGLRAAGVAEVVYDTLVFPLVAPGPWSAGGEKPIAFQGIYDAPHDLFGVVGDANWGLELARVPAAWNLRDAIRRRQAAQKDPGGAARVTLVVIDTFSKTLPAGAEIPFETFGSFVTDAKATHGRAVSSVAAGTWGNGRGLDGVVPVPIRLIAAHAVSEVSWSSFQDKVEEVFGGDIENPPTSYKKTIDLVDKALAGFAPVHVLNLSLGYNWYARPQGAINPATYAQATAILGEIRAEGRLFAAVVNAGLAASPGLIITIAAGNEGGHPPTLATGIDPRYESPWACASIEGDLPNGLVVGSTARNGDGRLVVAQHSNLPPQVYAPGQGVGIMEAEDTFRAGSGTSYAAPFVAGLAALLHALSPGSDFARIRAAILGSATPLSALVDGTLASTGVPVIDAFTAAMALDSADRALQIGLVDTDDGTRDGCTRVLRKDDGTEIGPSPEPAPRPSDAPLGDGVVDMRDLRRFRDAWLLVSDNGTGLDGKLIGERLHAAMDLNGNGLLDTVPGAPPIPPGNGAFVGENVWPRFDFNGDGVIQPTLAKLPFKGSQKGDLAVLAEVWGQPDDGSDITQYTRPTDVEGYGTRGQPLALEVAEKLLRSIDVEVRLDRMLHDPAHKDVNELEVHVWRGTSVEVDEPPRGGSPPDPTRPDARGPGSRRVHRDPKQWAWQAAASGGSSRLTFTIPVATDDKKVYVRAYYVTHPTDGSKWAEAEVTTDPATRGAKGVLRDGGFAVEYADAKLGEDFAVAFGPEPKLPVERYVTLAVRKQTKTPEIVLVTPGGNPPETDLLAGIADPAEMKYGTLKFPSGGLGCSARGEHVVFRSDKDVFLYRKDGAKEKYTLPLTTFVLSGIVVSDDRTRMVYLGFDALNGLKQRLVIRDLKSQKDTTVDLPTLSAGIAGVPSVSTSNPYLSMSSDGGTVLLNLAPATLPITSIEMLKKDEIDAYSAFWLEPWEHRVDLASGAVSPFYAKPYAATDPAGGTQWKGHVQTNAASFLPDAQEALFFSNEAILDDQKADIEDKTYSRKSNLDAELAKMKPGAAQATALTTASAKTGGRTRFIPVMSPSGAQVLYFTASSAGGELRLLNVGSNDAAIVRTLPKADYLVGAQDTVAVCWLRE